MSGTKPGADELRVRALLKERGVGPDARPSAIPPQPTERPRDWLDDILDGNAAVPALEEESEEARAEPEPEEEPDGAEPAPSPAKQRKDKPKLPATKVKRTRRAPTEPRTAWDSHPGDVRQSLLDAWARVPYRLVWLTQHGLAAGVGWRFGIVGWATDTAAWFAAGHWTSPSAFVLYALGGLAVALYRRTRRTVWPVACAAAIPVSSVVVGVLLYGTGYHP